MKSTDKASLLLLLTEAQETLESLPMGGIGRDGPEQAEIDGANEIGKPVFDDMNHHLGQTAWLILERAKRLLQKD